MALQDGTAGRVMVRPVETRTAGATDASWPAAIAIAALLGAMLAALLAGAGESARVQDPLTLPESSRQMIMVPMPRS